MLPSLSLSNVHNWFKVQGGFHLVPQLSFAPAAALLKEAEQGAGEELQTPVFFLDSETSKASFYLCCHPPASLLGNRRQAGDLRSHTLSPSSTGSPGQSHRQHQQQQQKSHLIGYWPLEQSNDISALPQPDALA